MFGLNMLQMTFILSYFNWIVYVVVFYISIFLVILTMIDVLYVSYAISKKKFSYLWPIRALRSVCGLFVTALFQPLTELFFSIMDCDTNDEGVQVNNVVEDIVCWEGLHIFYSASAIIVTSMFLSIALTIANIYFDISWNDDNPTDKISSDADVMQIYRKIVCLFAFTFFGGDEYKWMLIFMLLFTSAGFYYDMMFERPYLNQIMNIVWAMAAGIYFWTNILLLMYNILSFSDFCGGIELCLITYPLICLIVFFTPNPLQAKLMTPFKDLANGYDCFNHIRFFVFLASHDTTKNRIALEGYIKKQYEEEPDSSSLLKYNQTFLKKEKEGEQEKKSKKVKVNQQQKLMEHALELFKKALIRFPKCTFLRVQCALFLLEKIKNKSWALRQLLKAEKRSPSFTEQFLIYRFKRVIEEEMVESSEHNPGANLDIVSALAYQNHRQHWESYMEAAAQLHTKFWEYLSENVTDLSKLSEVGSEINSTLALIEEHWSRMQRYKQIPAKIIRLYAAFLEQVLNDKEGSKDLMKSVTEANGVVDDEVYSMDSKEEYQEINKFAEGGCGVIIASGEGSSGKIAKVNMSLCSIFGYAKSDLIGKHINVLLPKLYIETHKKLIEDALEKEEERNTYKENHVYGLHTSGYIMAIDKTIKAFPSIVNNWQYVVCVKSDKKKSDGVIATVLVDKELRITDVSFRTIMSRL